MPIGKYKDFEACRKEHTKKYCGALFWKTHGKKEGKKILKKKMEEFRGLLNAVK